MKTQWITAERAAALADLAEFEYEGHLDGGEDGRGVVTSVVDMLRNIIENKHEEKLVRAVVESLLAAPRCHKVIEVDGEPGEKTVVVCLERRGVEHDHGPNHGPNRPATRQELAMALAGSAADDTAIARMDHA